MKANYPKCLAVTLKFEGGYVNHPKDPGGATNFGITQRVYNSYRKRIGKKTQPVKKITKDEYMAIYKEQYWDPIRGDRLPVGVDLAIFDYAVNSGVSRAVRAVQKVLNNTTFLPKGSPIVKQDGQLGNNTEIAVVEAAETDEVKFITLYCQDRWEFVNKLSTFKTFGRGWKRRIQGNRLGAQDSDVGVIDIAVKMAVDDVPLAEIKKIEVAKSDQGGKASTEDVKLQATPEGAAAGTAGLGALGTAANQTGVGSWIGDAIVSIGDLAGFTKDQIEPFVQYSSYIGYAFMALGIVGVIGMVAVRMKKRAEGTVEA